MSKYVFLSPFLLGHRLITSQEMLDSIWINPVDAKRYLDPKKGDPCIREREIDTPKKNKKAEIGAHK